jgi:hypothetical protein
LESEGEEIDMMTEDFTKLPVGSLVSQSRTVIRCPQCHRHGVLETFNDGARRCIHVEVSALAAMVAEVTDRCELAGPRWTVSARAIHRF